MNLINIFKYLFLNKIILYKILLPAGMNDMKPISHRLNSESKTRKAIIRCSRRYKFYRQASPNVVPPI